MLADRNSKPKVRPVEPVPVVMDGKQVVALKDPLQLSDRMLCVTRETLAVIAMLDGRHSLLDIQATLSAQARRIVFMDDIVALVQRLDEANLLEGERFQEAYRAHVAEYRKLPCRPASHAGLSYAGSREALQEELKAFFTGDGGPGEPDLFSEHRRPLGLIAPHIDVRAGGKCFAWGYHALSSGQPSDVYVILGTGHSGVEKMFTATTLDFQTPLGIVETDRELLGLLSEELGRDAAEEEILHAQEHVIEFQTIFLQYVFGQRHRFKILPVLCFLSHHVFDDARAYPELQNQFQEFCMALRAACEARSQSVCFIASADLDHIGPRYGDRFIPHPGTVRDILEKDEQMLRALEKIDVNTFVRHVIRENDSRRICGFSPIITMLHCMDATEGKLLHLDFAQVDDRNSFVSFTSMIFH
ncbi:MAG: AmmeMemoRadiSam system protein B [Thermodesulfobacteriota bacterium]